MFIALIAFLPAFSHALTNPWPTDLNPKRDASTLPKVIPTDGCPKIDAIPTIITLGMYEHDGKFDTVDPYKLIISSIKEESKNLALKEISKFAAAAIIREDVALAKCTFSMIHSLAAGDSFLQDPPDTTILSPSELKDAISKTDLLSIDPKSKMDLKNRFLANKPIVIGPKNHRFDLAQSTGAIAFYLNQIKHLISDLPSAQKHTVDQWMRSALRKTHERWILNNHPPCTIVKQSSNSSDTEGPCNKNTLPSNQTGYYAVTFVYGGLYLDDLTIFKKGMDQYFAYANSITSDGTFPREMTRGKLATAYHSFGIQALLLIYDIAIANGYTPAELRKNSLIKVMANLIHANTDTNYFRKFDPRLPSQKETHDSWVWPAGRHFDLVGLEILKKTAPYLNVAHKNIKYSNFYKNRPTLSKSNQK